MPLEEAENVRPRDRLRRGLLTLGTRAGIGPWYDASPDLWCGASPDRPAGRGYPWVPVTLKFQDCTGQKVVLVAMTYGELSTMVPLQAFHPPLVTAP